MMPTTMNPSSVPSTWPAKTACQYYICVIYFRVRTDVFSCRIRVPVSAGARGCFPVDNFVMVQEGDFTPAGKKVRSHQIPGGADPV